MRRHRGEHELVPEAPRPRTAAPAAGSLGLQRLAGNRAMTTWVQRHAAPGLDNSFEAGGLSQVIFTPSDGSPSLSGGLSFTRGRMRALEEQGAARPGMAHDAPGRQNSFAGGGLTNVTFFPEEGPSFTGDLSFTNGRLSSLVEQLPVQRHSAQGLHDDFGPGGFSNVILTRDGKTITGDLSFRSGRVNGLTEAGGPGPKPSPKPAPNPDGLLSRARGSRGEEVRIVQLRLNEVAGEELDPDGVFGKMTDGAVRRFQAGADLKPDGIVGPATRLALGL